MSAGKSAGGGNGPRSFGRVPGRSGSSAGTRAARRVSESKYPERIGHTGAVGARDRETFARRRKTFGSAVGCGGHRVPTSRVARTAENSLRNYENVHSSGAGFGSAHGGASGGASVRYKSGVNCGAVPSRGATK